MHPLGCADAAVRRARRRGARSSTSPARPTCRCRCARAGCSRCWPRPGMPRRRTGPAELAAIRDALPFGVRMAERTGRRAGCRVCGLENLRATRRAPGGAAGRVAGGGGRRRTGGCTRTATGSPPHPPATGRSGTAYGATAEVGRRRATTAPRVHEQDVLAADPYRGDPARGGPGVAGSAPCSPTTRRGSRLPGIAAALRQGPDTEWAEPDAPGGRQLRRRRRRQRPLSRRPAGAHPRGDPADPRRGQHGDPAQVVWPRHVPRGRGTTPAGLRPWLAADPDGHRGGRQQRVVDGLVIDGDVVVGDGELGSLTLSQCTVSGASGWGSPAEAGNPGLAVRMVRGIAGRSRSAPPRRPWSCWTAWWTPRRAERPRGAVQG